MFWWTGIGRPDDSEEVADYVLQVNQHLIVQILDDQVSIALLEIGC